MALENAELYPFAEVTVVPKVQCQFR